MARMIRAPELDTDTERGVRFLLTLDERRAIMDGANIDVRLSATPDGIARIDLEIQGTRRKPDAATG